MLYLGGQMKKHFQKIISSNLFFFLIVALINFAFRIPFLDARGLWHDEAFSLFNSQHNWGHIKHVSEWDPNPPLYFYFLWIWRNFFGDSEFAIRISSVIFTSIAGGYLFLLVKKHFSLRSSFFASAFYLFSNLAYYYSHEARPYGLIILLSLLSTGVFFIIIDKPTWRWGILLGLLNFLLVYTHYLAAWILVSQFFVIVFISSRVRWNAWLWSTLISALLILLRFTIKTWNLIFYGGAGVVHWLKFPDSDAIFQTISSFFNSPVLMYMLATLLLLSLFSHFQTNCISILKKTPAPKILFLFFSGVGTFPAFLILSNITPVFLDRYMIFALLPTYILIAQIFEQSTLPAFIANAIVCVFAVISLLILNFDPPKPMNYKDLCAVVIRMQDKKTAIVVQSKDLGALFSYYYDRTSFRNRAALDSMLEIKNVFIDKSFNEIIQIKKRRFPRIILVQSYVKGDGMRKQLKNIFSNEITLTWFAGANVFYYFNIPKAKIETEVRNPKILSEY